MKIRLFSDIHNEIRRYYMRSNYTPWVPKELEGDKDTILILAGDVDIGDKVPAYMNSLSDRFKAIIHIAGNHEYYGENMVSIDRKMKEGLNANCYHLSNESVTIDGQHFFGGTMWTDLSDPMVELEVQGTMNDFRQIRIGGSSGYGRIKPFHVTAIHRDFMYRLANCITKDTIVISHHMPLSPENGARGKGFNPYGTPPSKTDYAYHACLEDFILEHRPKAWFNGHTHENHNASWFGTRLAANCIGYHGEDDEYDEDGFIDV